MASVEPVHVRLIVDPEVPVPASPVGMEGKVELAVDEAVVEAVVELLANVIPLIMVESVEELPFASNAPML